MLAAQWLLAFHITGGFLLLGGAVAAGALNVLALRAQKPSEIALLLGLVRFVVPLIGLGALLTLVLGLWLVHHDGFSYGAFWVWAAVVLWVIGNALGGRGGRIQERAREEAQRCAAEGDVSTDRLRELLRDPAGNAMSWGSGVAILLVLVLMIWKPGS
ncbi:MAG TPA: DUF2269 family protein [Gaiellaceae bacterium]|nr:DUF2269 family protein [Gaiellaceae bacterium]HVV58196.1 DUF2269 family protein [Gaiellaceae bacterium]